MLLKKNNYYVFFSNSNSLQKSQALISVQFSFHVSHRLVNFELCFEDSEDASTVTLERGAWDSSGFQWIPQRPSV